MQLKTLAFSLINLAQTIVAIMPNITQLVDVDIGQVPVCKIATECSSLLGNQLLAQATQMYNLQFNFAFASIPNIIINPSNLATLQLSPISFYTYADPSSISTTSFTAVVSRFNNSDYTEVILQYLATTNSKFQIQSQTINSYTSTGMSITVQLSKTFNRVPKIVGYLTLFYFEYFYIAQIGNVKLNSYDIQIGTNDFMGNLTVSVIIISQDQFYQNSYMIGAETKLINIYPSSLTNTFQYTTQYCMNYSSNQLLFGLNGLAQGQANKSQFQISTSLYDNTTCSWSIVATLQGFAVIPFMTIHAASLSLLSCSNISYYFGDTFCEPCHHSCWTCSDSFTCDSCQSNDLRFQYGSACLCQYGYFDDGFNSTCQACHYSCYSCIIGLLNGCLACNSSLQRTLVNGECQCYQGFFDNSEPLCKNYPCDLFCLTCFGPSRNHCSSCDPSENRYLNNQQCICSDGYYQQDQEVNCLACDESCKTCDFQSTNCTSCQMGLSLENGSCLNLTLPSLTQSSNATNSSEINLSNSSASNKPVQNQNETIQPNQTDNQTSNNTTITATNSTQPSNNQTNTSDNPSHNISNQSNNDNPSKKKNPSLYYYQANNSSQDCFSSGCQQCNQMCESCEPGNPLRCNKCSKSSDVQISLKSLVQYIYAENIVSLQGFVNIFECQNGVITSKNKVQYKMKWQVIDIHKKIVYFTNNSIVTDKQQNLIIPPNTLKPLMNYSVYIIANWEGNQFNGSMNIETQDVSWVPVIKGGNQRWGTQDFNQIELEVFRQGTLIPTKKLSLHWSCVDLNGVICTDVFGQQLKFNNTESVQKFQNRSLKPYQNFIIIVSTTDPAGLTLKCNATIQLYEGSVPKLNLLHDPRLQTQRIDIQLQNTLTYSYEYNPTNPDLLFFSANLYYDYSIVSTIKFSYWTIKFTIQDYFQDFTYEKGDQFYFMGSIYNPEFFIPSLTTLMFTVNIPPINCKLTITPLIGRSLSQLFTANISNCLSVSTLQFQFGYYLSKEDYDFDIITSQFTKLIQIIDYQSSPNISFFLPYSKSPIVFLGSCMDNRGAVTNLTQLIKPQMFDLVAVNDVFKQIIKFKHPFISLCFLQIFLQSYLQKSTLGAIYEENKVFFTSLGKLNISQIYTNKIDQIYLLNQQVKLKYGQLNDISILEDSVGKTSEKINQLLQDFKNLTQLVSRFGNDIIFQLHLSSLKLGLGQLVDQLGETFHRINRIFISNRSEVGKKNDDIVKNVSLLLQEICDITVLSQVPNENPFILATNYIRLQNQLATNQKLIQILQPSLKFNLRVLQEQGLGDTYHYNNIQYMINPYSSNHSNPFPEQRNSILDQNVKKQNQTSKIQILSAIQYNIKSQSTLLDKDINSSCYQLDVNHTWSNKSCTLQGNSESEFYCECTKMKPTTVFTQDPTVDYSDITSQESFDKVTKYNWVQVVLVYVIGSFTLIYLFTVIWADWLDRQQSGSTIQEIQHLGGDKSPMTVNSIKSTKNQTAYDIIITQVENSTSLAAMSLDGEPKRLKKKRTLQILPVSEEKEDETEADHFEKETIMRHALKVPKVQQTLPERKFVFGRPTFEFLKYLKITHPILGIYTFYDKEFSRISRATLIYLSIIQSLAFVLYLGQGFEVFQTIQIVLISTTMRTVVLLILRQLFVSQYVILRSFAILLFIFLLMLYIYVILVVIAVTDSLAQTNIWALQYMASFLVDQILFAPLVILLKSMMAKYIIANEGAKLASFLTKYIFKSQDMDIIFMLTK